MKNLLVVTAVLEAATGLALAIVPSTVVTLLLGSSLDSPASLVIGRLTGAALLTLGTACWFARNDQQSRATAGLITAMLLYNVAAVALVIYARLGLGLLGLGFWPVILLHGTLTLWCAACLRNKWA